MKDLKLVLKKKWYDMIASGKKKEEYREINQFWGKRLTYLPNGEYLFSYRYGYTPVQFKEYNTVTFYLGYAKDRPSMSFMIEGISISQGKSEWGAEPGKDYFVIKLGERL